MVKSGNIPLPGVTVTAQNTLTGKRYSTTTDITGSWSLIIPQNGRYVVRTQFAAFAQGSAELWTYSRYYPNVDAVHGFEFAKFSVESAYQPQMSATVTVGDNANSISAKQIPRGMEDGALYGGNTDAAFRTGGPQGGSMEPGDLRSYTFQVLFQDGKVARIGLTPNFN